MTWPANNQSKWKFRLKTEKCFPPTYCGGRSFCWTCSCCCSAQNGEDVKDCPILTITWTASSFLKPLSESQAHTHSITGLVNPFIESVVIRCAQSAAVAHHYIEDGTGNHNLIKHPEQTDVKAPQSSQKTEAAFVLNKPHFTVNVNADISNPPHHYLKELSLICFRNLIVQLLNKNSFYGQRGKQRKWVYINCLSILNWNILKVIFIFICFRLQLSAAKKEKNISPL